MHVRPPPRLVFASLVLASIAAGVHLVGLHRVDHVYWDERWYVADARRVIDPSVVLDNLEHPPLGKLVIGAFMAVFGDGPLGWRGASALSTALLLFLLPLVLHAMRAASPGDRRSTPLLYLLLPAVLIALDPVMFVNARLATLDAPLVLAYVAAAYAIGLALRGDRVHLGWAVTASVLAGSALAIKWTALTLAPPFLLLVFLRVRDFQAMSIPPKVAAAFLVPGAVIYVLSFLLAGHSLVEAGVLQWKMAGWHTYYFPPYWRSSLADWLVGRQPMWILFERVAGAMRVIISIGSPLACLTGFVALIGVGVIGARRRDQLLLSTTLFPLAQIALWTVAIRAIYVYYLSALLPFGAIAVAWGLAELDARGMRRLAGGVAVGLVSFAIGWMVFLAPVLTAEPLDPARAAYYFEGPPSRIVLHPGVPLELIKERLDKIDEAKRAAEPPP